MSLSADRNTPRRNGQQRSFPVAAAALCYAGGIAVLLAGLVKPATGAAGEQVVGVFDARADNSLGAASAINADVRTGEFRFDNSAGVDAITLADVGRRCYVVDDCTVARFDTGGRPVAGIVVDVDSVGVWVAFAPSQPDEVETEVFTITSAQLLALFGTPQTLVAAPGAGIAIVPISARLMLDFNTTAYDGIAVGEDLVLRYTDASGNIAQTIEATGFLDAAADAHRIAINSGLFTPTANAALVLHMATGNIATGNSPLKIQLRYKRVPLLA
jgi:hypothetical protein